jgi:hypothetical protein
VTRHTITYTKQYIIHVLPIWLNSDLTLAPLYRFVVSYLLLFTDMSCHTCSSLQICRVWKYMYYILFCICNWPPVFTRMTRNGLFFYKCMYVRMSLFNSILKHPHCNCCWWMYTSRCFSWFLIYGLDAGEMAWGLYFWTQISGVNMYSIDYIVAKQG